MEDKLTTTSLFRLGARLSLRQWRRPAFFAACMAVGLAFLSAITHLLSAAEAALALRARDLLAGDVEVSSSRPFEDHERSAFAEALLPGRRAAETVSLATMLIPPRQSTPFLVSLKAVPPAYPLSGRLTVDPPEARARMDEGGACLLERSILLQHEIKVGDAVRLGERELSVAGAIDSEPDRGLAGFNLAPRVMIALKDLPAAGLLGWGSRTRHHWTMTLGPEDHQVLAARAAKAVLEKALPEPHLVISSHADGEPMLREGARRTALFFSVLALCALLLGAAGLRAGLTLYLNSQSETMGLLRCLGASAGEVEKIYGGICLTAGMLGGLAGAMAGWGLAVQAAQAAPRFGLELSVPLEPRAFIEALTLSAALSWGLSAARVRALARKSPLDSFRHTPESSPRLAALGWGLMILAVGATAWSRTGSTREALGLLAALGGGLLAVVLLSRAAFKAAGMISTRAAAAGVSFPLRHGLRRLVRRESSASVMLFTLAGGFSLLASVGMVREGLSRSMAPALKAEAPDIFLVDVQPSQLERVKSLAAARARGAAYFSPLVRARLTSVDGRALRRGPARRLDSQEREQGRLRGREYNLTYAESLNASEKITAGRFWQPGETGAQASVEKGFLERAGLRLGQKIAFDISGREVEAVITSSREVSWASMRPNFFVTLTPELLSQAPRTYIGSLRAKGPDDAAGLRRDLARELPNVSVIDAAAALSKVRETFSLLLGAGEALAFFCVAVGALVTAGLVMLSSDERRADVALERALGMTAGETLLTDATELTALGMLAGAAATVAAVILSYGLSLKLGVEFAVNPREAALLLAAAAFLPAAAGLAAGIPGRKAVIMDALRDSS